MKQKKFTNKKIYHYTKFENFEKIIKSKTLHFSELGKSNDSTEGNILLEDIKKDYPRLFTKYFNINKIKNKVFVGSFCCDKDNEFLWRKYACDYTGFVIGFRIVRGLNNYKNISKIVPKFLSEVEYVKENVKYNNLNQEICAWIKFFKRIKTDIEDNKEYLKFKKALIENINNVILRYNDIIKFSSFEKEKETRIIVSDINDNLTEVENKTYYNFPIIEEFEKDVNKQNKIVVLPYKDFFHRVYFNEVIIGLKNNCDENTVRKILESSKYSVRIKVRKAGMKKF